MASHKFHALIDIVSLHNVCNMPEVSKADVGEVNASPDLTTAYYLARVSLSLVTQPTFDVRGKSRDNKLFGT